VDTLRKSIKLYIPVSDPDTIISAILGKEDGCSAFDLTAYFELYREVCYTAWDREDWDFTHEDVIFAAKLIREYQSKGEIEKHICASNDIEEPQGKRVDASISMVGFLISMCFRLKGEPRDCVAARHGTQAHCWTSWSSLSIIHLSSARIV
jgi:hypothetical protein